ncbi:vanadium-dependent haloperoxidase [Catellatospora sp. KI3]|uniref:vanadium-dependent haloperoxidase n=1 Tax=Catellatospora sp. KI3 TaxID=3041620 RepID=UPI0024829BB8|nr:vanadium-dependent haloperoxidase [Catellatospora sp. KI3]MDI1461328.1 vanadium-dependent haloperoxidase [Catellatospora sp. KI3]
MSRWPCVTAAAALASLLVVPATRAADSPASAAPPQRAAAGNAVLDWNLNTEQAILASGPFVPHVALLNRAMVHGAVYDAVNGITRTHRPYLLQVDAGPGDSIDAAAATAAYRMLVHLFPGQAGVLQTKYQASLAAIPDGPAEQGGIADGEQAAAAMIAARTGDGRGAPTDVVVSTTPGQWRPTPPNFLIDPAPWAGKVKPFLVPDVAALRSDGPNALTSDAYTEDFEEVKSVGSRTSTTRTADQTDAAKWWAAVPQEAMLRALANGHQLSADDSARLFAKVALATADAVIACHSDKAHWTSWRPITAIREADTDGNPDTDADPAWTPLLDTPPWYEHSSGHSCNISAWTHSLRDFFGTDKVAFAGTSPVTGTTRSFTTFTQARRELVGARVWGGIHFRAADAAGAVIGAKVAKYARQHYFQPVD